MANPKSASFTAAPFDLLAKSKFSGFIDGKKRGKRETLHVNCILNAPSKGIARKLQNSLKDKLEECMLELFWWESAMFFSCFMHISALLRAGGYYKQANMLKRTTKTKISIHIAPSPLKVLHILSCCYPYNSLLR